MRSTLFEFLIGAALIVIGLALSLVAMDGALGVNVIKTGTVAWAAGTACVIDAVVRPDSPPSRLLIGLLALAFAVSW